MSVAHTNAQAEVAQALMQQLVGAGPRSGLWDPAQFNMDLAAAGNGTDIEEDVERNSNPANEAHAGTFDLFSTTLAFIVSSEAVAMGRFSMTPSGVRQVPSNVDSDGPESVLPAFARGSSVLGGVMGALRGLQREREVTFSASGLTLVADSDGAAAIGDGPEASGGGGAGSGAPTRAQSGGGMRGFLAAAGMSVKRRSSIMSVASSQQQYPSTDGAAASGGGGGGAGSPNGLRLTVPGAPVASHVQMEEGLAHRAGSVSGRTPPQGHRSSRRMALFANKERRDSLGPREYRERRTSTESAPGAEANSTPAQPSPPPVIADEVRGQLVDATRLLVRTSACRQLQRLHAQLENGWTASSTGSLVVCFHEAVELPGTLSGGAAAGQGGQLALRHAGGCQSNKRACAERHRLLHHSTSWPHPVRAMTTL